MERRELVPIHLEILWSWVWVPTAAIPTSEKHFASSRLNQCGGFRRPGLSSIPRSRVLLAAGIPDLNAKHSANEGSDQSRYGANDSRDVRCGSQKRNRDDEDGRDEEKAQCDQVSTDHQLEWRRSDSWFRIPRI